MKLRYKAPASAWGEALPIGNGALGAMVFGGVVEERLQLNEDSLWYGGFVDRNNPDASLHLPFIRRLLREGKQREAEALALLALTGTPESQRHYMPMGDLLVHADLPGDYQHYERYLDLEQGTVHVTYEAGGVRYRRTALCSYPNQILALHIEADKPGHVHLQARLVGSARRYVDECRKVDDHTVMMSGKSGGEQGISYCTMLRAIPTGGSVQTIGEHLVIKDADQVTLLLTSGTTFRYEKPAATVLERLDKASRQTFVQLLDVHSKDYRSLYSRVHLQLGKASNTSGWHDVEPITEKIDRLKQGEPDPNVFALYFQYGRYLLLSSSRPGTLPANLQGIWNEETLPKWDSKFTININTQMNYWPSEVCNLAECHKPYFDLIERMQDNGKKTARVMYGCNGFVAHHNTDLWADTAVQDQVRHASYWPLGAAWSCLHLAEHYRFNPDSLFLAYAYPILKEAAMFLADYLVEHPSGYLVTSPSLSPENKYYNDKGEVCSLCEGPSCDSQIIRELFANVIEFSERLGIDKDFRRQLLQMQEKLPPLQIGRYGQIQEWLEDYEEVNPDHRHISHLFALFPASQITPDTHPELAHAARVSLERRLAHGTGSTGWSRAWMVNCFARLRDGAAAHTLLEESLCAYTYPNLFNDCVNPSVFQIDGNLGITAGIAEMLLQSHHQVILLLPALPPDWSSGSVSGLRARGGFEVSMTWEAGCLISASIKATVGGMCRIRYDRNGLKSEANMEKNEIWVVM